VNIPLTAGVLTAWSAERESTLRDIQEISKFHGQTSGVNSTHQNKEKILCTLVYFILIQKLH
jgi:hypothetical protein